MGLDVAVGVPAAVAAAGVADLDEPDALLGEPRRAHQELPAKVVGLRLADPVELLDVLGLAGEVDDLGRGELHPGGQFVGPGPGGDVGLDGVMLAELAVQLLERLHLPIALGGVPPLGGLRFGIGVSPGWNGVAATPAPR